MDTKEIKFITFVSIKAKIVTIWWVVDKCGYEYDRMNNSYLLSRSYLWQNYETFSRELILINTYIQSGDGFCI